MRTLENHLFEGTHEHSVASVERTAIAVRRLKQAFKALRNFVAHSLNKSRNDNMNQYARRTPHDYVMRDGLLR